MEVWIKDYTLIHVKKMFVLFYISKDICHRQSFHVDILESTSLSELLTGYKIFCLIPHGIMTQK